MEILFDTGPLGHVGRAGGLPQGTAFRAPTRVIRAQTAAGVPAAFAALEAARREGRWLAGWFAYELGYLLDPSLRALLPDAPGPLLEFGVFDAPAVWTEAPQEAQGATRLTPEQDFDSYRAAFDKVQEYLCAGDTYQVNLTFPMRLDTLLSPRALHRALRHSQPVAQGAYVDLGGPILISRAPELFFSCDATGRLTTRPMKGTAARGATAEADRAQIAWLRQSEKNLAENLMIVDLMRNDLSRIALPGTVRVPHLFEVETYPSVHQMTSTVTAALRPGTGLGEILTALFPCGSITGAPKIRAMQIIRELEPAPRGGYCGAIGWIAPDGEMSFNVAIRTLQGDGSGAWRLSVGGGVVVDSTAETEYAEALSKARFCDLS